MFLIKAQEITPILEFYSDTMYVFSDVANIREGLGINFKIKDKLLTAEKVFIINDSDQKYNKAVYTSDGLTAEWLPIKYYKQSKELFGYVWRGNLSTYLIKKGDIQFMMGISAKEKILERDSEGTLYENEKYRVELKVIKNNQQVAKKIFTTDTLQNFISFKAFGNLGLTHIHTIVCLEFLGGACAIPTNYYYLAWNGRQLLDLPSRYTVSDAGVYSYEEKFIFPNEKGGKPNQIIKKTEIIQVNDESASENTSNNIFSKSTKKQIYIWNGKNYIIK
ncbi:hypothetical protein [Apibacter sp. HY039]|uniref:hypothetical protein n=1 Tax=Apibacter sp. HY039 TaxID=2501476 RepID=UPI000FEBAB8F|nr:hypothetical protein [Apibacter sp. HY039]